jgi:hypothetical protein
LYSSQNSAGSVKVVGVMATAPTCSEQQQQQQQQRQRHPSVVLRQLFITLYTTSGGHLPRRPSAMAKYLARLKQFCSNCSCCYADPAEQPLLSVKG